MSFNDLTARAAEALKSKPSDVPSKPTKVEVPKADVLKAEAKKPSPTSRQS
jgi:hypothetical protein